MTLSNRTRKAEAEPVRLKGICSRCNKSIKPSTRGSLSSWLLRPLVCTCESEKVGDSISRGLQDPEASEVLSPDDVLPDLGEQFEVLSLIGEGGMGRVFKVRDRALDRILAVKLLRLDLVSDALAVKRFEREARAAEALTHPNLVTVYGHGEAKDGSPYIVMDHIDGRTVADVLRDEGAFEIQRAIKIFIEVCEGLSHAHKNGLIHRDLKPSNIILRKSDNGEDIVQLVDFGIAKLQTDTRITGSLTSTEDILGSPSYMSPEQCIGAALDSRSDIYSMGCLMYEMLTGVPPFQGSNPVQIIIRHLNETPLPPDVPSRLSHIIMRCLRKEPSLRYVSAAELKDSLESSKLKVGRKQFTMRHLYNLAVDIGLPQLPLLAICSFFSHALIDESVASYSTNVEHLTFFLLTGSVIFGMYWASIWAARLRSVKGLVRKELLNEHSCGTQATLFFLLFVCTAFLSNYDLRQLSINPDHYSVLSLVLVFVGWILGPLLMYLSRRAVDARMRRDIELSRYDRFFKLFDRLLPNMPED